MRERAGARTSLRLALFAMAGLAAAAAPAAAPRTGDLHLDYTFAPTGETMPYRLYVPTRYRAGSPMPLIVVLHGGGGDENSPIDRSALRALAEQRGYIVLSVRGYAPTGGYGEGFPIVVTRSTMAKTLAAPDPAAPPRRAPWFALQPPVAIPVPPDDYAELPASVLIDPRIGQLSEQETLAAIAEVRRGYAVDPARMYLMGNSMGGTGTLWLGAKYAEMWAAIAPSAGALAAWSYPYARLKEQGVAMLFVHGERDQHVSPHWSAAMAGRARAAGVDAAMIEVPGGAHEDAWITALPRIFDFFDRHRRAAP